MSPSLSADTPGMNPRLHRVTGLAQPLTVLVRPTTAVLEWDDVIRLGGRFRSTPPAHRVPRKHHDLHVDALVVGAIIRRHRW